MSASTEKAKGRKLGPQAAAGELAPAPTPAGSAVGPDARTDAAEKVFVARHRFARLTGRKARLVATLIRGKSVNEALELLEFAPQRGATFFLKVLQSAIANAAVDEAINVNRLFISECKADDGPLLNGRLRWRPGPQGRAMPFQKRLSHLTIKVRELPDAAPRVALEERAS